MERRGHARSPMELQTLSKVDNDSAGARVNTRFDANRPVVCGEFGLSHV
jgi:hypothetical protein